LAADKERPEASAPGLLRDGDGAADENGTTRVGNGAEDDQQTPDGGNELRAALEYAVQGRRVVPVYELAADGTCTCRRGAGCAHPGKHPRITRWQHRASADPAVIGGWWRKWPSARVGIATGEGSGVIVLDVDPRSGGHAALAELQRSHGMLPATLTATTPSGGEHRYYLHPGGAVGNSSGELGPGLDVRGDRGMVVAPPTIGRHWSVLIAPAPLPPWLAELVTAAPKDAGQGGGADPPDVDDLAPPGAAMPRGQAALEGEAERLRQAPEGERNAALNRAAFRLGQLAAEGDIAPDVISSELETVAADIGLEAPEIADTIGSGMGAGMRHPRADSGGESAAPDDDAPHLAAIPAYPTAELGGPVAALIAATPALPAALVGGAALAGLAGALGPMAELEVRSGWAERAIIWAPLIAPRGAGKSPAQAVALGPLRADDARLDAIWRAADRAGTDPRRLVGDTTLEALARTLATRDGAALLDADELTIVLRGWGEYKGAASGDRARALELWTGAPWTFQRVTAKTDIHIPRPTLAIVGGLQPELAGLLGDATDGYRPRWLPHLATLDPEAQAADGHNGQGVAAWAERLDELGRRRYRSRIWTLDHLGRARFEGARQGWKRASVRGLESASVSAAMVKADVQAARIALVLAEGIDPGRGGPIPPEALEGALALIGFTLGCWRALEVGTGLRLTARDARLDAAVDELRVWLEQHGGVALRSRLAQAHVAGVRSSRDLDTLLTAYGQVYPGTVRQVQPRPQGGRPGVEVRAPRRA